MKLKGFCALATGACLTAFLVVPAAAAAPRPEKEITAATAVLMDADTGQVLYDRNMHTKAHPASMTKVMTGLLAMELASPDEMLTVSDEAASVPRDTSHIWLSPGEQLTVDSAMYALMLPSANDAANALAEHVAGSLDAFPEMMNRRAAEIGAGNTRFENAHGLPDQNHLTTAYDMALITREAIRNDAFLKYFGTGRHTIPPTNLQAEARPFTNQQFMLLPDQGWAYNPEVIGGKVGYTEEAKHTMTSAARRGGRTLIAVVMGCGADEKFYDTQALLDFGFDQFVSAEIPADRIAVTAPVTREGETVGEAIFTPPEEALTMLIPKGSDLSAAQFRYTVPDTVEADTEVEALVMVTLAGMSREFAMTATVQLDPEYAPVPVMAGGGEQRALSLPAFQPWWLLVLAVVPLAILAWLLVRREKIRRRAERRRQRQERILRERRERQRYSA